MGVGGWGGVGGGSGGIDGDRMGGRGHVNFKSESLYSCLQV